MFTFLSIGILFQLARSDQLLYKDNTNAVTEFDFETFKNSVELDRSDRIWVVVFYAHWCGHCVSYAPEFMRLAESLIYPSQLEFGAIDCASPDMSQIDSDDVCRKYDVRSYPTIRMFRHGKSERDLPREIEELKLEIATVHSPESSPLPPQTFPKWIRSEDGSKFTNTDSQEVIHDASLAMYEILRREVFRGSDTILKDADFTNLMRILEICFNSGIQDHMRKGCESALAVLKSGRSLSRARWNTILAENFPHQTETEYRSCAGFSCAMWRLLHVMTFSSSLESSSKLDIRFVIDQYFSCEECRKNFLEHFDKCDFGVCEASDPISVALWLWRLHNGVNERLGHGRWPAQNTSETEVYDLLRSTYISPSTPYKGFVSDAFLPFYVLIGVGLVVLGLVAGLIRNSDRIQTSFNRVTSQVNKKYYEPIV